MQVLKCGFGIRGIGALKGIFDLHLCIATDCMLGGQPNHGWQLCFPL